MPNNAHVTLVGTVTQAPKNDQTTNNQTRLTINLAVQTTKQDPNPKDPRYKYLSDYYAVRVYGKQAEMLLDKIKVGTKLLAMGEMYMGEPWKDRQGETHITPGVTASNVQILSGGNYTKTNNASNNTQPETEEEAPF